MKESLSHLPKPLIIFLVVALYWIISISLVFINKYLLSDEIFQLKTPLMITWFQCVISLLLCVSINLLSKFVGIINVPACPINYKICEESFPLAIIFVGMIIFNNLCLKHVGISFYYIGRSLTTVFNVIFVYFILRQRTSLRVIMCCVIIIAGFLLGVDQENVTGTFSYLGGLYGILASACVALYSIYLKKLLPIVDESVWRLTFYNNFNACFVFIPILIWNGEFGRFLSAPFLSDPKLWGLIGCSGLFGFAIGYVTGLQIQVTSPLTHNISGTAKAAFQTLLGVLYYHEIKSLTWWLSNVIVLGGSMAYTHIRHSEMSASKVKNTSMNNGSKSAKIAISMDDSDKQALLPSKP
ncbi:unnamed protein product [Gordionus sp. m RMFG-2023]|uniref:GDP-fucose transporter 1-like n=1 Tax=Gordionus sp. m RMFG-2023 TaxID=3053472 RepID=UPI0030DFBFE2